jgi:hypothetical protein
MAVVRAAVAVGVAVSLLVAAAVAQAQGEGLDRAVGEGVREQSCLALAASTVGAPERIPAAPTIGIPPTWDPAPAGLLPAEVHFRGPRESFNRVYEFAARGGEIYVRKRGSQDPWRRMPLPACFAGKVAAISADDDEMIALDTARRIYTMDNALKDGALFNWSQRWGTPFWLGTGYSLPGDLRAWAWSVISPLEDGTWTDPAGNRTAVGDGKVSHIWGLRRGGQRLTFWDPWLPHDDSYEMCGPHRGRFRAHSLSASGSHIFVIGPYGDMFTRLYDFDLSGHDAVFFRYSYENQRGHGDGSPIQLPAEPWTEQPKIRGRITDRISVSKAGAGAIHAILRVEGTRLGRTGYWERDIASPRAEGWRFHPTGGALVGRRLRNLRADSSARGLGPGEDMRFELRSGAVQASLENFNVYCSPARLTVRDGRSVERMLLHTVDGLRQQARARGLDHDPRVQYGAIEYPPGHFQTVTVQATSDEVAIPERGWRFRRVG